MIPLIQAASPSCEGISISPAGTSGQGLPLGTNIGFLVSAFAGDNEALHSVEFYVREPWNQFSCARSQNAMLDWTFVAKKELHTYPDLAAVRDNSQFFWDTAGLPDGEYELMVLVRNRHGFSTNLENEFNYAACRKTVFLGNPSSSQRCGAVNAPVGSCHPVWRCSQWTACANGVQTCTGNWVDDANCGAQKPVIMSYSCFSEEAAPSCKKIEFDKTNIASGNVKIIAEANGGENRALADISLFVRPSSSEHVNKKNNLGWTLIVKQDLSQLEPAAAQNILAHHDWNVQAFPAGNYEVMAVAKNRQGFMTSMERDSDFNSCRTTLQLAQAPAPPTGGACVPNWKCDAYSSCVNRLKHCLRWTDLNNCGFQQTVVTGVPCESEGPAGQSSEKEKMKIKRLSVLSSIIPDSYISTADFYVGGFIENTQHGTVSLLEFEIPDNSVERAVLVLEADAAGSRAAEYGFNELIINVHQNTDLWNRPTWNAQPGAGSVIGTVSVRGDGRYEVDITSIVNAWVNNPSRNYGIRLEAKTLGRNLKRFKFSSHIEVSGKSTGTSITQRCADGSQYNQCTSEKPRFCNNGQIVDKCGECGCPTGKSCRTDGSCVVPTVGRITLYAAGDSNSVLPGRTRNTFHTGPALCDGQIEARDFEGRAFDSGWVYLNGSSNYFNVSNDCTPEIAPKCMSGYNLTGYMHTGPGKCDSLIESVSESGNASDSGWVALCTMNMSAVIIASHNDCTDKNINCPSGYVPTGRMHAGPGKCDGKEEIVSWDNEKTDAGWATLCAREKPRLVILAIKPSQDVRLGQVEFSLKRDSRNSADVTTSLKYGESKPFFISERTYVVSIGTINNANAEVAINGRYELLSVGSSIKLQESPFIEIAVNDCN